ncbi:hypothetical protein DYB37_008650 [Aphanomyces astaci]|uniref:Uncharacterized protein n=1 Tax=Aphanomyces astaci TaxID=112090 RepID=A0A397F2G0_APHAT|nr:hypothetical protein AaE_001749 [Aphanomyces astaci]RHX97258.1 hypothetical protein DYB25_004800 [Aphanomyces astaci]RHY17880.1 hypothetical protein DYB36_010299 [Aphanomyces astaci]RHY37073.1 hypothetical protein DYB34_007272 [Aphanomyces astaci]RHY46697.1 hypothetical protein DYB30_008046 [Aphanomyces astaci]
MSTSSYRKEYYEKNKDRIALHQQKYHRKHRDHVLLRRKAYKARNQVSISAQHKEYQQRNRDKINAYQRDRRQRLKAARAATHDEIDFNNKTQCLSEGMEISSVDDDRTETRPLDKMHLTFLLHRD